MTESRASVFKKRYHLILGVIFLLSIYATGFVDCFLNPKYKGNIGFINILKAFFTTKETIILLPLIFVTIGGIGVYIMYKAWKDSFLEDKMGRAFKHSGKISPYGDAHVMEPHEYTDIAQIRKEDDCKGIIVGRLSEDGLQECVDFNPKRINSHIFITAMSGSGKTFGFVKPYIFQSVKRRHSLVMTDPKGELFQETAGFLADNGYHVRRLDFKNLRISDGWDCLKLLRGKNMRTKVQIFSNAVISNISQDNDSIFAKGSDSLLQALILRVLLGHDFPEEKKTIKSVYDLLQNPAGYEFLETMFDKNALTEEELPCLAPYLAYKQGSQNLSANIATHLANGLTLFQDENLCNVLSTDDIDLVLPGKEPCAYYCIFPDDHDTYKFVISLFFTMFFIELVDYADDQKTLKLQVPVDFLLDEFPSIGIIPDWSKKMSTVRSRGISCVMITQDFTQLRQNYEDTWATILNNCGALITLGINEMETAKWISERIGESSIEVESTSESEVAGSRRKDLVSKQSIGVGKRSLLTPSEVFEIGQDSNLVIIAGRNPIYSLKTPFVLFKAASKLRDVQKEDLIDFYDKEARKVYRECENAYIKQYWQAHSLKPKGDPYDLSDAMYTEPPESPISMIVEIIKEDMKFLADTIKKLVNRLTKKDDDVGSDEVIVQDDDDDARYENAPRGAFLQFYEDWKQAYEAQKLMSTAVSPFEVDIEADEGDYMDYDDADVLGVQNGGVDEDIIPPMSDTPVLPKTSQRASENPQNASEPSTGPATSLDAKPQPEASRASKKDLAKAKDEVVAKPKFGSKKTPQIADAEPQVRAAGYAAPPVEKRAKKQTDNGK